MANFGRKTITQADKPRPDITYFFNGEERIDRRPQGRRVERFVDPVGNVVSLQLAGDGDPAPVATADRVRMEKRRDGFIEHAKCPLRHGTHMAAGQTQKDFVAMFKANPGLAEPCAGDKKTMERRDGDLYAVTACPHVEALIAYRVKKEADQNAKRNAARIKQEERDEAKRRVEMELLELAKDNVAERKARRGKSVEPKE